jgi:hypothetical protein
MFQALSCHLRRHHSAYKSQTRWRYGTWEIRATSLGSSPWTSRIPIRKMGLYLIRLYLWAPLSSKIKRIFTTCQMNSGPCWRQRLLWVDPALRLKTRSPRAPSSWLRSNSRVRALSSKFSPSRRYSPLKSPSILPMLSLGHRWIAETTT